MDYLTVKETAELKGCSERYIKTLCKDSKIKADLQPHPQNKQLCYMIPVSALPEDLQAKYYRKKKTEAGILPEKIESSNAIEMPLKCNCKSVEKTFQEFSGAERETIVTVQLQLSCRRNTSHKELLEFAHDNNPKGEYAFIFSFKLNNQLNCVSKTSSLDFSSKEAINTLNHNRSLYVM